MTYAQGRLSAEEYNRRIAAGEYVPNWAEPLPTVTVRTLYTYIRRQPVGAVIDKADLPQEVAQCWTGTWGHRMRSAVLKAVDEGIAERMGPSLLPIRRVDKAKEVRE